MCVCCLYFGMLFSDWGDAHTEVEVTTKEAYYQNSTYTVVVKCINFIIAIALLIVSMALPICCPDRIL
jgi:hypothetical protein